MILSSRLSVLHFFRFVIIPVIIIIDNLWKKCCFSEPINVVPLSEKIVSKFSYFCRSYLRIHGTSNFDEKSCSGANFDGKIAESSYKYRRFALVDTLRGILYVQTDFASGFDIFVARYRQTRRQLRGDEGVATCIVLLRLFQGQLNDVSTGLYLIAVRWHGNIASQPTKKQIKFCY